MTKLPQLWFHGDRSRRESFRGQRWDRKRNEENLNTEGPGLYWTTSYAQARSYAAPDGAIYAARLDLSTGLLTEGAAPKFRRLAGDLFDLADPEDQYTFITNFGLDIDPFSKREMDRVKATVLKKYTGRPFEVALSLYTDLYRFDAEAWVRAMVASGVRATLIERRGLLPKAKHCVVYDLSLIELVEVTGYAAPEENPPRKPSPEASVEEWMAYHDAVENAKAEARGEEAAAALLGWLRQTFGRRDLTLSSGDRARAGQGVTLLFALKAGALLTVDVAVAGGIHLTNARVVSSGKAEPKAVQAQLAQVVGKRMKYHKPTDAWALDFRLDKVPPASWPLLVRELAAKMPQI